MFAKISKQSVHLLLKMLATRDISLWVQGSWLILIKFTVCKLGSKLSTIKQVRGFLGLIGFYR